MTTKYLVLVKRRDGEPMNSDVNAFSSKTEAVGDALRRCSETQIGYVYEAQYDETRPILDTDQFEELIEQQKG